MNCFVPTSASGVEVYRALRVRLCLLAVAQLITVALSGAELILKEPDRPAWFGHNMVLQQDVAFTLRGRADKSVRTIRLEFPEGRKLDTCRLSREGEWSLDFPRLKPSQTPTNIVLKDDRAGTVLARFTNVVVGEVWVMGSLSTPRMPFDPTRRDLISRYLGGPTGGWLRYLPAPSLRILTNPMPASVGHFTWQIVTPEELAREDRRLSNPAAYLALTVLAQYRGFVGVVETRPDELSALGEEWRALPRTGGDISQAFNAVETLQQARKDYAAEKARYDVGVAALKRQGLVTNVPPPLPIEIPSQYRPSLKFDRLFPVRGYLR